MRGPVAALAVAAVCIVVAAGCIQGDGAPPPAGGDVPDRLDDLARDLLNLAGLDNPPVGELRDDLMLFAEPSGPEAVATIEPLEQALASALNGLDLSGANAAGLAEDLWLICAARDFSDRQMATLRDDLRSRLLAAGADDAQAQAVAERAADTTALVRDRRWYELF